MPYFAFELISKAVILFIFNGGILTVVYDKWIQNFNVHLVCTYVRGHPKRTSESRGGQRKVDKAKALMQ